jgi:hypothetical protein
MAILNLHIESVDIIYITTVLAASIVSLVALTESGSVSIAQGQANLTSLTPDQKASICYPNDTHINTTESRICGKPITPSGTSSANNTSSSILPSVIP